MKYHPPQEQFTRSTSAPSQCIQVLSENWRGKSDPVERRRIQNRLNQRRYRQKRRSESASDHGTDESTEEGSPSPVPSELMTTTSDPGSFPAPLRERLEGVWDQWANEELGLTINRNVLQAVIANVRHLGITQAEITQRSIAKTPRPQSVCYVPANLLPVDLQLQVPHDRFLDGVPHPRFRYNALRAMTARHIDPEKLCQSLRGSGQVVGVGGRRERDGVVVWGQADDYRQWELSEAFVMVWYMLLEGCEEWIASTNAWRSRRGEAGLVVPSRQGS